MDPVTHAAIARMAVSVSTSAVSRGTALLAIAAGLAPDVDAIFMPVGWDVYLRVHETGTHSLAGAVGVAAALVAAWRPFTSVAAGRLFAVASTGVASHLALDVLSGASIRLASPLAAWRTNLGLVAMADPWLAAPVAIVLLAAIVTRLRIGTAAPYVLAFTAALMAGKAISRQMAIRQYREVADPAAVEHFAQAQWGSLTRWWIYERTPVHVRARTVDVRTGVAATALDVPVASAHDLAWGEDHLTPVRNALVLFDLPVRVTRTTATGTIVFWSDLRFCFSPSADEDPAPGSHVRPTAAPVACGVWFGGELDHSGRVARQFVTIGEHLQAR